MLKRKLEFHIDSNKKQKVLLIDGNEVKQSYNAAMKSKENLCHCGVINGNEKKTLHAKMCCSCNCFVRHGHDKPTPMETLLNKAVEKAFSEERNDWCGMELTETVKEQLKTQHN